MNIKKYYEENKDKILNHCKEYRKLNRDKINEHNKLYINKRITTDPIFWLIVNNRTRIYQALKSNSKVTNYINLLGSNRIFFYQLRKYQLPYDMNDDEFRKNYDIDHCRPIATFNLSDPDAQYDAYFWQNCQPLLKYKNRSKGAKLNL